MTNNNFNEQHIDVLKEIGNVGAGHATTALSKLLNRTITMSVPEVNILPFDEVTSIVGGPEKLVSGVYLEITGEAPGAIMLLLEYEDALKLVDILMGYNEATKQKPTELHSMEQSALTETGNIIASSYLKAMGDLTNLRVSPTPPAIAVDMAGAILEIILFQVDDISDRVLLIDTEFSHEGDKVRGHFFLIPNHESFDKILKSLGINNDKGD